jgi:hypothetical protein
MPWPRPACRAETAGPRHLRNVVCSGGPCTVTVIWQASVEITLLSVALTVK